MDEPYPNAQVVWMNEPAEDKRLVLRRGDRPEASEFSLEYKDTVKDALGNVRWRPLELNADIFKTIMISVFVKG